MKVLIWLWDCPAQLLCHQKKHLPQIKEDFLQKAYLNMPEVTVTSLGAPTFPFLAQLYYHIYCKPISQRQALSASCQGRKKEGEQPKQNRLQLYYFPATGLSISQKTLNRSSFSSNLLKYDVVILPSALLNNQKHVSKYICFPSMLKENRMCLRAST